MRSSEGALTPFSASSNPRSAGLSSRTCSARTGLAGRPRVRMSNPRSIAPTIRLSRGAVKRRIRPAGGLANILGLRSLEGDPEAKAPYPSGLGENVKFLKNLRRGFLPRGGAAARRGRGGPRAKGVPTTEDCGKIVHVGLARQWQGLCQCAGEDRLVRSINCDRRTRI